MSEVSRSETIHMLDGVPLFAGLNKRQLAAVAKVVDHMTFEPGAELVKELEVGRRLIVIREGTAQVRRQGSVGAGGSTEGMEQVPVGASPPSARGTSSVNCRSSTASRRRRPWWPTPRSRPS
jgi:hypothetical protein